MRRAGSRALRILVDAALAGVLVSLMATAIVEDFAHEWLGIAAFLLLITHLAMNRRFLLGVFRGRYSARRVALTIVDVLLIACVICLVASSLVLSQHAFGWLPAIPGVAWARPMHMLASYWGFLLAFVHLRMHIAPTLKGSTPTRKIVWAGACVVALVAGIVAFMLTGIGNYLFLGMQFVYLDPSISPVGYALLYLLLAIGAAALGHVLRCLLDRVMQNTHEKP